MYLSYWTYNSIYPSYFVWCHKKKGHLSLRHNSDQTHRFEVRS
jgi:hypothetical protein